MPRSTEVAGIEEKRDHELFQGRCQIQYWISMCFYKRVDLIESTVF